MSYCNYGKMIVSSHDHRALTTELGKYIYSKLPEIAVRKRKLEMWED